MTKANKSASSRVALYARVSTEEQAGEEHFSIDAQFAEMRETAVKKGWEVVAEFVDEGISGTRRTRPQLEAALSLAHSGGFDILMVHELSRLSRSVYHTLDLFDTLGKIGVGFASVRDPDFDFADPSKRLFLTILAAINEHYITALSHHTKKAKRERARQGLYNASSMPYGYKLGGDPRTPAVIDPQESQIVRFAFENYSTGRFSDQEIAEQLNSQGHRTRAGRRFSKDTITSILSHPFYMGKVPYRDAATGVTEIYEGLHTALISPELWEKVQDVRTLRRTLSRAVQKKFRTYLLSNMAVCDVCGRTLRGQSASSVQYYREMSSQRGYVDCPHQSTGVRVELLDRQISTLIECIQLPPDWLDEITRQVEDDQQLVDLRRQRDRLEAERHRIQQMRIGGDFDDNLDDYHAEMDRIRREIAALPTYDQIETIRITGRAIEDLYQVWDTASDEDRRDLLRLMLREVRVDVPNGRIVSFFPLASFLPIFRRIPMLVEHEFGEFVPLWSASQVDAIANLRQIPSIVNLPDEPSLTLPFFDNTHILPPSEQRTFPGMIQAIHRTGRTSKSVLSIFQVLLEQQPALPMDLRKWPRARADQASLSDLLKRPTESVDVVISQYLLWDQATRQDGLAEELLPEIWARLRLGGVWYFVDLLPQDFPAHWLYRLLPAAWQWAKANTWTLYTLYDNLVAAGFETETKRQAYYQPVSPVAAREILRRYPGFARTLTDNAIEHAIERLSLPEDQIVMLPSEFTVIEAWAKRK